ncbi:efflux RND transporter periplasmic adaptor subunit [Methylomagnum ishizawai]|uniref:efflux RND transporter periplasmic adaptor subunit n=1 Tax=Methylomagnum ishizawai TaxID=1760988 RepID=UPI001C341FC4|nr:efflux RND transporter periplasmic adaptor subunit [Methylomagnum ishizawai]BBL77221.1 acriflavin resistance protein [Methylomagnum ishizawai]
MKPWKILLPLAVLLGGIAAAAAIVVHGPALEAKPSASAPPTVRVLVARPETVRLDVHTQGVVQARTEIDLAAEVSGKVVWVHPGLVVGGYIEAGETVLSIDPRDYDNAIVKAQARVAEAQRGIAQEQAAVRQAQGEWKVLGEGQPTPLALHEPQMAEARARLKEAEAGLADARLRRERCDLRVPFAGQVREKRVGIGQSLAAGDKLARVYSVDVAEIRLALAPDQLAYLDLPENGPGRARRPGPKVVLSARNGGEVQRWEGEIIRTEGVMEEGTGVLFAVAEVRDPYGYAGRGGGRPPLRIGQFVQAEIEGRARADVYALPQGVLNAAQEALLVDAADRLRVRRLEVLRSEPERVLVRGGLAAGERVVVSGVEVPVAGMAVQVEP